MSLNNQKLKWIFLVILSLVWGSSFILMKKGLDGLTAIQVGSVRIIFTATILIIIGFNSLKKINKQEWKWIVISGLLGSFIPIYMFPIAETEIDSSIVSILNSFTPLNTLIFGYFIFKIAFYKKQLLGVFVAMIGSALLIISGSNANPEQNYMFAIFVFLASICYAINVNIIKKYLQNLNALSIAVGNFVVILIPAVIVLVFTGFFNLDYSTEPKILSSLGYILILALFGTAISKVIFNRLVQISTPVFSTSVTYTIPVVAFILGFFDGEKINVYQIFASLIILLGVYLVNKKKSEVS